MTYPYWIQRRQLGNQAPEKPRAAQFIRLLFTVKNNQSIFVKNYSRFLVFTEVFNESIYKYIFVVNFKRFLKVDKQPQNVVVFDFLFTPV